MIAYILGPMTGYPDDNRPAFKEAAAFVRSLDLIAVSPDELDEIKPAASSTWEDLLRRDLDAIRVCTAGIALPGWEQSKGARLEATILHALGCPIYAFLKNPMRLEELPPEFLPSPAIPE